MIAINARPTPKLFGDPTVGQVVDGVHVARGFDLGNVVHVATAEGPVVIDTTSGVTQAAAARDALAEASPGGATYVVYTHCHNDHTSGATAFVTDGTRDVVSHADLPSLIERDHGCLGRWTRRHRAAQRGRPFDDPFPDRGYVPPSLTFDDALDLEVGGLTFHLEHTEGESRDHLLVWIPELKLLCPGDLIYPSFPNLSTPAVGPRPIEGWLASLERFMALAPEHLVGSHGPYVSGRESVAGVLGTYHEAITSIWDQAQRAIDEGVPVDVAARTIRLPGHLAGHPWLREIYGTVNWGVRAVYDRLTGWFDLTPGSLNPLPRAERDGVLVGLAGPARVLAEARRALDAGRAQLAVELVETVLAADEDDPDALGLLVDACRALRATSTSANEKGFYHSAIRTAQRQLDPRT